MMGWYPPLNELSDSTWHMFTHVVESNQHSLHDIYVHGRLYPTSKLLNELNIMKLKLYVHIMPSSSFTLGLESEIF